MPPIDLIALTMGTSFASGLNAYAVLAAAGLFQRMGWVTLPATLEVLANPFVLGLTTVLFLVEFVADKVPYLDTMWDAVHTFIRPAAAAVLAVGALGGMDPVWQVIAALASGSVALTAHGAKASTRAAANVSPEPFSNVALSVGEDASAIGLTWLAIAHPLAAGVVAIVLLLVAVWVMIRLYRFVTDRFQRIRRMLGAGGAEGVTTQSP
ncbi:MAG TPA: DUF4126 domain-containing protein [Gemmatimonadales bacterium]|nr:DUF4126 domain-containing protein [Gemmatimonadales bacterium]